MATVGVAGQADPPPDEANQDSSWDSNQTQPGTADAEAANETRESAHPNSTGADSSEATTTESSHDDAAGGQAEAGTTNRTSAESGNPVSENNTGRVEHPENANAASGSPEDSDPSGPARNSTSADRASDNAQPQNASFVSEPVPGMLHGHALLENATADSTSTAEVTLQASETGTQAGDGEPPGPPSQPNSYAGPNASASIPSPQNAQATAYSNANWLYDGMYSAWPTHPPVKTLDDFDRNWPFKEQILPKGPLVQQKEDPPTKSSPMPKWEKVEKFLPNATAPEDVPVADDGENATAAPEVNETQHNTTSGGNLTHFSEAPSSSPTTNQTLFQNRMALIPLPRPDREDTPRPRSPLTVHSNDRNVVPAPGTTADWFHADPVAIILVAGGVGAILALVSGPGRLWALARAISSVASGLFAREQTLPDRLENHPSRQRIMEVIRTRPGIQLADLRRETGLAKSTLQHHVRLLARGNLVQIRKVGGQCHVHVAGVPPAKFDRTIALRATTTKRILETILAQPGIVQKELAAQTGNTRKTIRLAIDRLLRLNLVREVPEWKYRKYYATGSLLDIMGIQDKEGQHA